MTDGNTSLVVSELSVASLAALGEIISGFDETFLLFDD